MMRDHKKSLELIHYFQPPNTSNSNNVFFKKKKEKERKPKPISYWFYEDNLVSC